MEFFLVGLLGAWWQVNKHSFLFVEPLLMGYSRICMIFPGWLAIVQWLYCSLLLSIIAAILVPWHWLGILFIYALKRGFIRHSFMCNATGLWMECVCIIDISDNVAKYILWPVSFFHFTLWVKKTTLYSYSYLYQMLIKQFTHNVVRIPRPRKVIHVAFMRLWTLSCICQYYDDFVGVYIYIYIFED